MNYEDMWEQLKADLYKKVSEYEKYKEEMIAKGEIDTLARALINEDIIMINNVLMMMIYLEKDKIINDLKENTEATKDE